MQKWEYLQLAYAQATAFDSTGRVWKSNTVIGQMGVAHRVFANVALWWSSDFSSAFSDLGAEGWELVGIVPSHSIARSEDSPFSGSLLIFKRAKP